MSDQFVQGDTSVGPGEAPPLPEGTATQLNDANAQTPAPEPQTQTPMTSSPTPPASPAPAGQEPASPLSYEPQPFVKGSTGLSPDEEAFLTSPTERPDEPIHAGVLANGDVAPSPDVYAYLDSLRMAAADPTAPPQTQMLLALVAQQLP